MNASILKTAAALSDRDLLSRLQLLAGNERVALVELLGHLAELDTRQALYAAAGYGSLFAYCTRALGLSEDAACYRVEAARACRRFPMILDLLADGAVTLTAVRMIARHLTPENHVEVLAAARRRTKTEIEALVARLAPKPDAKPVIRRLDTKPTPDVPPAPAADSRPAAPASVPRAAAEIDPTEQTATAEAPSPTSPSATARPRSAARAVIRASAPARFLVQLTVGQDTHDRFRRLQDLCARECRGGDPVAIFDLMCLVTEKEMLRRKRAALRTSRRETETRARDHAEAATANGRHVPADVRRAVWARDGERCAFVGAAGRCADRRFLELHHRIPWALGGPTTVDNLAVRCRTHNVYEAEQVFGAQAMRAKGMGRAGGDRAAPQP